jgi:hypothetical protein
MGFLERVFPGRRPAPEVAPRHARPDPVPPPPSRPPPPAPPPPRTDLTLLLGRNLVEPLIQDVCREYALLPALGAGPPRLYRSPGLGVELAADGQGTVMAIQLHFHGDDEFAPYRGPIPGRGSTIPRRSSMWASLGRPDHSTDPHRDRDLGAADQWRFPTFLMHAEYALDGDNLLRLTLRY